MYNVYHGSWRDFTTAVGAMFTPKWIRYLVQRLLDTICTMYVRCMYARWRLVNDWRRLSRTLVRGGVIGELFEWKCWRENVCGETFCSLRSHGTRFAYGRLRAQALSQPCLVMGRVSVCAVNKLTTANLCDRKKTPPWARWCYDSSMSLRNSRLVLRRLYFVSPITPCPVW